jgi:hypothetical protein
MSTPKSIWVSRKRIGWFRCLCVFVCVCLSQQGGFFREPNGPLQNQDEILYAQAAQEDAKKREFMPAWGYDAVDLEATMVLVLTGRSVLRLPPQQLQSMAGAEFRQLLQVRALEICSANHTTVYVEEGSLPHKLDFNGCFCKPAAES